MIDLSSFPDPINVAVIGASGGIGSALTECFIECDKVQHIYALSRGEKPFASDKVTSGFIDITDESSIDNAAQKIDDPLHLIIAACGILHDDTIEPEKALRDLNMDAFQKSFSINIFGPGLVAKSFLPKMPREGKSVFAALSAKVGSISDNQIGGWYAYRASKAALNMFIKTASIEMGRRYKEACVIGLHPGTVDTALSKPFQSNVQHEVFSPQKSAEYLLSVIDQVHAKDSGKLFGWDGAEILP